MIKYYGVNLFILNFNKPIKEFEVIEDTNFSITLKDGGRINKLPSNIYSWRLFKTKAEAEAFIRSKK